MNIVSFMFSLVFLWLLLCWLIFPPSNIIGNDDNKSRYLKGQKALGDLDSMSPSWVNLFLQRFDVDLNVANKFEKAGVTGRALRKLDQELLDAIGVSDRVKQLDILRLVEIFNELDKAKAAEDGKKTTKSSQQHQQVNEGFFGKDNKIINSNRTKEEPTSFFFDFFFNEFLNIILNLIFSFPQLFFQGIFIFCGVILEGLNVI